MLRDHIADQLDQDPRFRWRGESVTRIENLSDIAFALALGMLVSASSPPNTFDDLRAHLIGVVPVIASFSMLVAIWNTHFTFFRRYGLADSVIVSLNAALLLVILFVAYPLRFIFDSLFAWILVILGNDSRMNAMGISTYAEAGEIMAYFSVGYACTYLLINLMYERAASKSELLELNATEQRMTLHSIVYTRVQICLGVLIGALAMFTPIGPFAGFLFWIVLPLASLLIERKYPLDGV